MFRRCFRCFCWWWFQIFLMFHPSFFGKIYNLTCALFFRWGWVQPPTIFFLFVFPGFKNSNFGMGPMGFSFPPKGSSLGYDLIGSRKTGPSHSHSCPRYSSVVLRFGEWTSCVYSDIYNNTHIYIYIESIESICMYTHPYFLLNISISTALFVYPERSV